MTTASRKTGGKRNEMVCYKCPNCGNEIDLSDLFTDKFPKCPACNATLDDIPKQNGRWKPSPIESALHLISFILLYGSIGVFLIGLLCIDKHGWVVSLLGLDMLAGCLAAAFLRMFLKYLRIMAEAADKSISDKQ